MAMAELEVLEYAADEVLARELAEATEIPEKVPGMEVSPFAIDSDERAEWLLRKLNNLEAEAERVTKQAGAILDGIERDKGALLRYFGPQLREYCELKLEAQKKGRSVKFLQGTCRFRTVPGGPCVVDAEAALAYCDEHDDVFDKCVTVTARLRAKDYLAHFAQELETVDPETGEVKAADLPGIGWVEGEERFYIGRTVLPRPGEFPTAGGDSEDEE